MPFSSRSNRFESLPASPFYIGLVLSGFATVVLGPILPVLSARLLLTDVQAASLFVSQFTASIVGAVLSSHYRRLSVVLGYKARIGALALLVFMAISTWLFHGFTIWNMLNRQARHDHVAHLLMNMSIMGAMLFIVANGAGQMSVDGPRR